MDDALLDRMRSLTTSGVSDALDRLRIAGQCHGLRAVTVDRQLVGPAFTVRFAPVSPNSQATVGDYLDDVPPGAVVVLDNGGRTDVTVWGDILSLTASRQDVAGTIIDGVCRDAAASREVGYPVYARGNYMRTGKDRVQVAEVGGSVTCSTAQVGPDDLVIADGDGVVIIPASRAEAVIEVTEGIEAREAQIRAAVLDGVALGQARGQHGYFELQRGGQ